MPPAPLSFGEIRSGRVAERLRAIVPESMLGSKTADPRAAMCVLAGLHCWNDDYAASHTIAQGIEDADGSYWHAIDHRREPDYANCRYWFRRAGTHPVYPAVRDAVEAALRASEGEWAARSAVEVANGPWDADRMVGWCESAEAGRLPQQARAALEAAQDAEIRALLADCLRRAAG
jgi:hypothetical protein